MSDSDDYGDGYDDTEFFNAATQAEKEITPAFQPSPRPTKRRRVSQAREKAKSIPSEKISNRRRQAFADSSDEDDGDESFGTCNKGDSPATSEELQENRPSTRKKRAASKQHDDIDGDEDVSPARATVAQKRKERIHIPTTELDMTDVFFTQPPREHSPPWKPRGAIWAKPTSIGVHKPAAELTKWTGLEAMKTMALPGRQSISSRPKTTAPVVEEDPDSIIDDEGPSQPLATVSVPTAYDYEQDLADLPSDAFSSSTASPQKHGADDDITLLSATRKGVAAPQTGLRQTTLFGRQGANGEVPPSQVNKRYNFVVDQKQEPPTHHKLDHEALKTWVYPTNLGTIRDYQFNIVQRGLFNNLLVALPTGLGKTFIAATIMLNWYRWTVDSQIVFVAPTKPLVSQQVGACFGIAGIPRSATTMLTGGVQPGLRSEEWKSKRVFFMTPQTLLNDLKNGYADPKKIVLLVVDEAHRATGSYAYVEVVSFLRRFNQSFRILALTATPGADVEAVQKVIDGLDISKVEIRTENSMDICNYVHQRRVEKRVFQNSDEMEMCMDLYSQALQPLVNQVAGLGAYWSNDPRTLTPYGCTQAAAKWVNGSGRHANPGVKNIVRTILTLLASIAHAMDLMKYHGMAPFYTKLKDFRDDSQKTKSKYKKQILESDAFKKLMTRLDTWMNDENFAGHPKLEHVQECILEHFVNAGEGPNGSQTRIMVFAHFRDSAEQIVRILKKHEPMIRPRVFVGQATAKNSEGMNQKEQLSAIEEFKSGKYNTLIATSIGEEGLDIGEVDLIICYDSKASPIRMLQRMGRTGRKREGKIIMLQMQGKEENDANKAKDSYENMQELIANGSHFTFHDEISRRIAPADVKPVVDRRIVDIPPENSQQDWLPEPKRNGRTKKPPKKFHMPDGVLTGFVTAGCMGEEIIPKGRGKKAPTITSPSEEVFEIPSFNSVLLDESATRDLERRFQTVYDEDDAPMVSALDLGEHADHQRTLTKTHFLLKPGRKTQTFVATMQRIHDMDANRVESFRHRFHHPDYDLDDLEEVVDNNSKAATESQSVIHEDMWADDDPASQEVIKSKAKSKAKAKAAPNPKAKPAAEPKAKAPPKILAPRGRPQRSRTTETAAETPVRRPVAVDLTPKMKTPDWQVSALAGEGEESSPPPTDPRFHIASQADTIGSQDTLADGEVEDSSLWKQDSELASFIVDGTMMEEEEQEIPASSLPGLDFNGLGKATQAMIRSATKSRRPLRAEKFFTSDITDNDAVVSSDSDNDSPLIKPGKGANKRPAYIIDSASEVSSPVLQRMRVRRVIEDDDDDE
ncbi:P-loop containing nucleoside triphosphate hydrolase protein [Didymella exigua CBS 183.55]|uniref:ATP-dependent DNA helicase n=1 Tax=Didymella exigua CBS 183.55 TaxID=1150837 RepID=A0A6A5RYK4_9PLEO|nr:P-loop containing nucleoside triphosphate hydrolase protein [Didymella exigua CBS 183.55]KAF1932304.1 P-loop containing nucleoside triphosphate hydrolase protein [Didymella exigua CBS 183.55]